MHLIKFTLILCLAFFLSNNTFAQKGLKSKKDKKVFIDNIKLPMASPSYNLSFMASHLDLDYVPTPPKEILSLDELLIKQEYRPQDFDLAIDIARQYKSNKDYDNAMIYYEHAYKIMAPQCDAYPDSFELVEKICMIYIEIESGTEATDIWGKYVEINPTDVRGFSTLALREALEGEYDDARKYLEKAYALDPTYKDMYITAMLCSFMDVFKELSAVLDIEDKEKRRAAVEKLKVDVSFLERAVKEKAPPAAQMAWDASDLLRIMLSTFLEQMGQKIGEKKVKLKPSAANNEVLTAIEGRALKMLEDKVKNPYFAHKVLTSIAIFRSDTKKAMKYFEQSGDYLKNDPDILRLLSLGHFLNLDYAQAAVFEERTVEIAPAFEDYLALGRFYHYLGNIEKSAQAFDKAIVGNPNDYRALCSKVALAFENEKWEEGIGYLKIIVPEKLDDIEKEEDIYFYQTLLLLLEGEKEKAVKRLEVISKEEGGVYQKQAKKLHKHFSK